MTRPTSLLDAFRMQLVRDLRIAWRRWSELTNPLMFFVIVATLFPLALSPAQEILADLAPGIIWVAALLSSLLALENLVRSDFDDGTLEQAAISGQPLTVLVLAKVLAHWLVSGLPLVVLAPLVAGILFLPTPALGTLVISLLLGTPVLSLLGAVGAALTVSLRRGGVLLSLLVLPLSVPVLIFGARATDMAAGGESAAGPLYFLAALLFAAISLTPFASAAGVRISLD